METVRLTPHSRLRRLVKTSRLRLTGVLQTLETRGTVRDILLLSVPAHICAVGLYCKATRSHLRHTRVALATKPCSQKFRTRTARKSSPQGVTIPNAKKISSIYSSFLHNEQNVLKFLDHIVRNSANHFYLQTIYDQRVY